MKHVVCEKCGNLYIQPDIEGVQLNCGAFVDFLSMDVQETLDQGMEPSRFNEALGNIEFNSVSSCGGTLKEITEEEAQHLVDKKLEEITFKGVRERK